jgi:hypothetical protein
MRFYVTQASFERLVVYSIRHPSSIGMSIRNSNTRTHVKHTTQQVMISLRTISLISFFHSAHATCACIFNISSRKLFHMPKYIQGYLRYKSHYKHIFIDTRKAPHVQYMADTRPTHAP